MKILILTASTGGGHKRAAAALEAKIKSLDSNAEVKVVDAFKAISRAYDKTICDGYKFMATKIPKVYGVCYKITDKKSPIYDVVMRSNNIMSNKLLETIEEFKPDVAVLCHPFLTTMVSRLKRKNKIDVKTISIITDYDAHRTYFVNNIDAYVVAVPQMVNKLITEYGVEPEKIYPLGIPIFDNFSKTVNKEEICKREGLNPNLPTVLLMAGSFGVSSVLEFYKDLAEKSKNTQLIVITGKNQKLYAHLEKLMHEIKSEGNTKLMYFVDNVEDYMHISDVIVTKPGGLTVTESLACSLPLAIYNAFPGQEYDNARFLESQNAAVLLNKHGGADEVIKLLEDKDRLCEMKEKCKQLSIHDSAENIYNLAKKLYEE